MTTEPTVNLLLPKLRSNSLNFLNHYYTYFGKKKKNFKVQRYSFEVSSVIAQYNNDLSDLIYLKKVLWEHGRELVG